MDKPFASYIRSDCKLEDKVLEQLAHNEKMAELGRLAAGIVHEVNTPLSVIISAAQMVEREEGLSDFAREMIERIEAEAQRLSQFSRGLLSFTRKDERHDAESDVNQVLREVMAFLSYEARKRSIRVVGKYDYAIPSVRVDGNGLKQILINLIMNGLQAMDEGGTLLLTTSVQDDTVRIEIADTGIGIPPHVMEHIFEPFFTTKVSEEGTGLGLFITKKLVDSFHGTLSVRSSEGSGTTFTLSFPALHQVEVQRLDGHTSDFSTDGGDRLA